MRASGLALLNESALGRVPDSLDMVIILSREDLVPCFVNRRLQEHLGGYPDLRNSVLHLHKVFAQFQEENE